MQPIFDHIASVVRPALRNYLAAEKTLTIAVKSNDTSALDAARQDVMLLSLGPSKGSGLGLEAQRNPRHADLPQ
jgi:hypothetical protein